MEKSDKNVEVVVKVEYDARYGKKDGPAIRVVGTFANLTGKVALDMTVESPDRNLIVDLDSVALFKNLDVVLRRQKSENCVVLAIKKVPNCHCNNKQND